MTACAVCNAPPPLTLTRNGLRCSKCLLGELELYRGIVSDLAGCRPVQGIYNGGHAVETCALCGATGDYEDEYLTKLRIKHAESCPWRRAVDLKL